QMDDVSVLQHRCLLNLERRIRDFGQDRPAEERCVRLQKDGDTLSYQGNSEEVGCYMAGHPLSRGNRYFEVTIVDTGVRGTIAVGLVPKFYKLDHQPGWLPYSVAYHADNGKLYNGDPVGQQFGPKCSQGDRIGCGIHSENVEAGITTVFFTKNSQEVGFAEVPLSVEGLFPAVGMHSMGEEVKVDLQAKWHLEEDESMMMVDSHEDDWGRLHDVRASGTLKPSLFCSTVFHNKPIFWRTHACLLEYVGNGKSIMDVGLAQARQPLSTRRHYYELEIVDAGEKCYIALGLARRVRVVAHDCSCTCYQFIVVEPITDGVIIRDTSSIRPRLGRLSQEQTSRMESGIGGLPRRRREDLPWQRCRRCVWPPLLQGRHHGLWHNVPTGLHPGRRRAEGVILLDLVRSCFHSRELMAGGFLPQSVVKGSGTSSKPAERLECLLEWSELTPERIVEVSAGSRSIKNLVCLVVQVFFTRNGKLMGRREMVVPPGGLYPTVGMLSSGEKVKVDLQPLSG
ncbi:unnamed protein product, partial [Tetraodon nigroviridis]